METDAGRGRSAVVKKFNEHSPRLFRNANKALNTIPSMLNRPAQDLGAPRSDDRLVPSADAVACIKVDRNYRSEAAIVKGAAVGKVQ